MSLNSDEFNTSEVLKKIKDSCDEQTYSAFYRDAIVRVGNDEKIYLILQTSNDVKYIQKNFSDITQAAIKHVFGISATANIISTNEYESLVKKHTSFNFANSNLNKNFLFEDYIEADFNKEIIALGKKILNQNKVSFNPLFIYSFSGMGKTHFLNALGNELVAKGKHVCYVNPEQFIKKVTQYLITSDQEKLAEIVEYYKNFDFLLFDDIQQFGSKAATLNVLFNIINSNIENQKQIIIASDKNPELLGGFEDRFITRFQGGITQDIAQPSLNDLMKIFEAKLIKHDIDPKDWETEAIKFIIRNHSSSIRTLEGAINKIEWNKQKNIQNIKYTYNVVSQMFSTISKENTNITPDKIIEIIAKYYKINKNEILGKSRRREIVLARQISMWMIRNLTNLTYKEIGKLFKGKDHSTVMASIEKIDYQMKINETVKNALKHIKEKINEI
ncbi:chromosomal replication initiator protein DnaA [Mesomycoplasma moatsii]|uniref:chromosomal replication initiator protein DnaA n=1 Tax=Mesomycoplasma moatsii TaxID=171287 RepID=UPI0003B41C7B